MVVAYWPGAEENANFLRDQPLEACRMLMASLNLNQLIELECYPGISWQRPLK